MEVTREVTAAEVKVEEEEGALIIKIIVPRVEAVGEVDLTTTVIVETHLIGGL